MRHDFAGAAQADDTRSKLVSEPAVNSLYPGAFLEKLFPGGRERKPFAVVSLGDFAPSIATPQVLLHSIGNGRRRAVRRNQWNVSETSAVGMDRLSIVSAVHQIVERGHSIS